MLLQIRDLCVSAGPHEIVAIEGLDLPAGRRLGLVGESGSGKTMTAMSIAGLQPPSIRVTGSIRLDGDELVGLSDNRLARIRGSEVGVVFQDPLRALNPTMRIGRQVSEALRIHSDLSRAEVRRRVLEVLLQVQLPQPEQILRRYPHQLSGGQRQRVLIATAIACRPKLLIADEPTTALDVTVQKGILELLVRLSDEEGMALLFVSHDLGVVRAVTEHIAVMYAGQLVETGPANDVIERPHHRYTEALVAANPGQIGGNAGALVGKRLRAIDGTVPAVGHYPSGCRFRGRCPHATDCCAEDPEVVRVGLERHHKCKHPAHTLLGQVDDGAR